MKKLIVLFALLFSPNTPASVMYIQANHFVCSDTKIYDVARVYHGGWGPGSWSLVALCSQGTLTLDEYNGRVLDPRKSHPDIDKCMSEDAPALRVCFANFIELNGKNGDGEMPTIVHAKKK